MLQKFVIVRSNEAGIFYGLLSELKENKETGYYSVMLNNARRIWSWQGAATISELAVRGTSTPEECLVPAAVESIMIARVLEIIPLTQQAKDNLYSIPEWSGW